MGGRLETAGTPAAEEALYAFSVAFPMHPTPASPRPTYVSLVGLSVLVVSSDSEQRLQLATMLRGWRMVPLEADNAAMAIALLERLHNEGLPVPLVILGGRPGREDPFLLAFRIKHHERLAPTIVVLLASEGRPGDALACRENGIAAYMRYPVNERQLNEAVVAVTGASMEPHEEADTLVTRHSLREHRKGATVLLVDGSRESQLQAAHVLARQDCNLVIAEDYDKALAALDQDLYDLVLVDTTLPGFEGDDAAAKIRARITRDPQKARIIATGADHGPAFRVAKTAIGFTSTIAKPFRREELLALLQTLRRVPVQAH
jgi:CheY-like chemotaxis protein